MDTKKLELGHDKCFQIHVGKNTETCPELNVHQEKKKLQLKTFSIWFSPPVRLHARTTVDLEDQVLCRRLI